ncbi:MAG: hypothetical protein IJT84_07005 [Clostridia bacterium]|nr:hypothetical protein [Clostridia bacterium]
MNNNKNFYEDILKNGNGKINKDAINKAKNGDTSSLLNSLSPEDRKKVNDALNDKEKLKQILSSDAAKKLLNLLGGKNNG